MTHLMHRRILLALISVLFLFLVIKGSKDTFSTPINGLELDSNLVVTSIVPNGPAAQAGFQIGDQVISINSEPVERGDIIADQGRNVQINTVMNYRVLRQNQQPQELSLKWEAPSKQQKTFIIFNFFSSIFILTIITITCYRNPDSASAILFYCLSILYLFFRMDHPRWQGEFGARFYQAVYLLCFFLIPALFVHFYARFPKKNQFLYAREGRIRWLYAPTFVLFVPAAVVNWIHYSDLHASDIISTLILIQGLILWACYLIAGTLMMIRSFLRIRSRELTKRCVLLFYALLLAVSPYLLAGFLEIVKGESYTYEIIALFLFLPFPMALAYAIDFGEDPDEGIPWFLKRVVKNPN